ncbi:MAG: hypothetical protein U9O83_01210 [Campylobacterota bacterium]|nr:hypothetical protein [Campylobacterota bacterium]
MSKQIKKHNRIYTVQSREEGSWLDVIKDKVGVIAVVPDEQAARQVIYNDLRNNGVKCEYLTDENFTEI